MSEFRMPSLGADISTALCRMARETGPDSRTRRHRGISGNRKGRIEVEIFENGKIESLLVQPGQKVFRWDDLGDAARCLRSIARCFMATTRKFSIRIPPVDFQSCVRLFILVLAACSNAACGSLASKGMFPEVGIRQLPAASLSPTLVLENFRVEKSAVAIDSAGRAQIFMTDTNKRLYHLELFGSTVISRQMLGEVGGDANISIDAIERAGELRVLAGDRQYLRPRPDSPWLELKGNRCARFIAIDRELFCAFAIKGEEVHAPKRTDYTFGWFVLFPVVFWSTTDATKLVLAQESAGGWIVRAVVDPETPLDAEPDIVAATDDLGNVHLLYFATRGGGAFFVGVGSAPGAFAAGSVGYPSDLRHAQFPIAWLVPETRAAERLGGEERGTTANWLSIQSSAVGPAPFSPSEKTMQYLRRRFSVMASGEIRGLIWTRQARVTTGTRTIDFGDEGGWAAMALNHGWPPTTEIVAVRDLPDPDYRWALEDNHAILRHSKSGTALALLENCSVGFWKATCSLNYFERNNRGWSAPVNLGPSYFSYDGRALATDERGCVFATWMSPEDKFVGRWIGQCAEPARNETESPTESE